MNKTELEFSVILEAMKRKGEIYRWEYEAITLRFAGVRYTPDFLVFYHDGPPLEFVFMEVKGPFTKGKYERAIERFRHARSVFPEFLFELHQKQKGGQWKRLM